MLVTKVHFTVYSTNYPLVQGLLPDYLLKNDSIYPLIRNRQPGAAYDDNLCAFRCPALHQGHDIKSLETPARTLYREWTNRRSGAYDGIDFQDFPDFEALFKVNLEVYSLEEDGFAWSVYKSRGLQETTMHVNIYENHLSYIRKFAMYAQKYVCQTCDRHFKQLSDLHTHQRTCANKTIYVYTGGFYRPKESIFDRLDEFGINVNNKERVFP